MSGVMNMGGAFALDEIAGVDGSVIGMVRALLDRGKAPQGRSTASSVAKIKKRGSRPT